MLKASVTKWGCAWIFCLLKIDLHSVSVSCFLHFALDPTGTSVEAISEERASRSLHRIQLLSKIREEVGLNAISNSVYHSLLFLRLCFHGTRSEIPIPSKWMYSIKHSLLLHASEMCAICGPWWLYLYLSFLWNLLFLNILMFIMVLLSQMKWSLSEKLWMWFLAGFTSWNVRGASSTGTAIFQLSWLVAVW